MTRSLTLMPGLKHFLFLLAALGPALANAGETKPTQGVAAGTNKPAASFHSGVRRTPLLELYVSEGCSSCPPAEDKLSGLSDAHGLWKSFVPLAWHVEYWNNSQWQDRWSDKTFGDRQRCYAALWQRDRIHTPGFVWDGKEWTGWLRMPKLPAAGSESAGILTVSSEDGHLWQLRFRPASPLAPKVVGCLALLGNGLTSDVRAGENAGRKLRHDFVVLRLMHLPLTEEKGTWTGTVELAVPAGHGAARLALAAWVAAEPSPRALQATGGWLGGAAAK